MNRRARLLQRAATFLPQPIAEAPERVFINVICVAVGIAVLMSDDSSALWTREAQRAWALAMLAGGVAALVGYWGSHARGRTGALERVGYLTIMLASLAYSVRVVDVFGWRGVPIGLAFLGFAAAKAVRLLISGAAREQLIREEPGDAL